eukprot:PhF_6_TR31400/c0_g1_i2/m.46007
MLHFVVFVASLLCTCNTLVILPVGDSITEGSAKTANHPNGSTSYRRPLYFQLRNSCSEPTFIGPRTLSHQGLPPHTDFPLNHSAMFGMRAVDAPAALLFPYFQQKPKVVPDVVLVLLGTNDLFHEYRYMSAKRTNYNAGIRKAIHALKYVVHVLRQQYPDATTTKIYVSPLTPSEGWWPQTPYIPRFNRMMKSTNGLCSLRGLGVRCLPDLQGVFIPKLHTVDGLHPNEKGDEVLATRWSEAILADSSNGCNSRTRNDTESTTPLAQSSDVPSSLTPSGTSPNVAACNKGTSSITNWSNFDTAVVIVSVVMFVGLTVYVIRKQRTGRRVK